MHLIAHQCLRVFFRLGISSFVTENLVQSRSIMWMIVSTHLPASPSPEKHESKATEWGRDHPAVQAMTLNLTLNARRCLVGAERGWFTSAPIILLLYTSTTRIIILPHTSTASIILLVPGVFLLRALVPRALLLREGL